MTQKPKEQGRNNNMKDEDLEQGLYTLIEETSYVHVDIEAVKSIVNALYREIK